uniref:omega-amidase n=1 Tax=Phlebotomus papatasi TaxID=29031 RepID=A0A1B0GN29_PHLPP
HKLYEQLKLSDLGIGKFNKNLLYLPGICFDIEFDEFARVYRNEGCNFLVYPAAFPIYTGELHWELYQRARAADTQSYVTMVSASRDYTNPFVNWGYTTLVDPWARVIKKAGEDEEIIKADLDFSLADSAREQLPVFRKRRTDMYEVVAKHRTAGDVKEDNVTYVMGKIRAAVADEKRTSVPILVVLPELFNSPYGPQFFDKYAELIPDGYTSKALSAIAKELGIYIIGGSYPERDPQNPKTLYNTCTVWGPKGELLAKHRKVHLYDIEVPNKVTFKESTAMTPGKNYTIVEIGPAKIGIGE